MFADETQYPYLYSWVLNKTLLLQNPEPSTDSCLWVLNGTQLLQIEKPSSWTRINLLAGKEKPSSWTERNLFTNLYLLRTSNCYETRTLIYYSRGSAHERLARRWREPARGEKPSLWTTKSNDYKSRNPIQTKPTSDLGRWIHAKSLWLKCDKYIRGSMLRHKISVLL
jgi:hypothetical protein